MATLHIRVKNNTAGEMQGLRDDMQDTADAAVDLGDAMVDSAAEAGGELAKLRDQHEQQIKVIHEHRAGWSQLAASVIPAITAITTAGISYAGALAEIAARQKMLDAVMLPVLRSQQAWNFAVDMGQKAAIRGAASLAGYGAAAARIGTAIGFVTVAVKGFETLLANTGRSVKGTTEDFSEATDEQVAAFNKLADSANTAGIDIETAMAAAGHSWEDFGVRIVPQIETNLTRVQNAAGLLQEDLAAFGEGGFTALKEMAYEAGRLYVQYDPLAKLWSDVIPAAMQKMEEAGGRLANNLEQGMERIGEGLRGVEREASQASKALDQLQKDTVDDFARVRISEQQATKAAEDRAEAARIAGMATTQAIDDELAKMKERRGIMAANDQFDEAAQQKYLQGIEALERRRSQLLDQRTRDEAEERRKRVEAEKKANEDMLRLQNEAMEARNKLAMDFNARQQALGRQAAQDQQDLAQESRDAARDSQLSALNRNAPGSDDPAAQRQHASAVHQMKRGFIQQEFNERKAAIEKLAAADRAAATSDMERQKIDFKEQEDLLAAKTDAMRNVHSLDRQFHEQRLDWVAKEKKAAQDKHKQAVADAAAQWQQDRGNGQGNALEQLRNQFNQRAVARQVGNQRADAASTEFRTSGRAKEQEDKLVARGMDRADAERRVMSQQRKIERDAFARGFGDTVRGKNTDEAAAAQNQLVQASAAQAQATGELSPVMAQGLQMAAQQLTQTAQIAQQAKLDAEQAIKIMTANGQRLRATNGTMR